MLVTWMPPQDDGVLSYTMPGTDLDDAMPCLAAGTALGCYAMSGIDILHGYYAVSGTDLGHGATRGLRWTRTRSRCMMARRK
eukprot:1437523-Rhodomonas_salina.1